MEKLVNQPIKNGGWISNFFRINIYHDCLSWTIESMNFTSTICTFPSKLSEDPKLKSLREDTFPLEEICLQVKKVLKKTYTMKITPKNYQLQIKPTFQANKKHQKKKTRLGKQAAPALLHISSPSSLRCPGSQSESVESVSFTHWATKKKNRPGIFPLNPGWLIVILILWFLKIPFS